MSLNLLNYVKCLIYLSNLTTQCCTFTLFNNVSIQQQVILQWQKGFSPEDPAFSFLFLDPILLMVQRNRKKHRRIPDYSRKYWRMLATQKEIRKCPRFSGKPRKRTDAIWTDERRKRHWSRMKEIWSCLLYTSRCV